MNTDDIGKLVLRLTVGGLLLFHGVHKILTGIQPIRDMLGAHGMPDFLAYGVYVGEVAAPLLIIFGLASRLGGVLVVINMIVAIFLAGMSSLVSLNAMGGYALELEMFFLLGGLSVALLGAGRFGLGGGTLN
ncbi:MAG TPA: DoxX family protein [Rhizomicrobium sp.]|nr:DoxX family protein [Rhizomicrobium sp.]